MDGGKVWLVGAGPGDPGLLTCRGREILDRADAVVCDRLVGDGILALVPSGAEVIDVGKEGGRHPVPQREIEKLLVGLAQAGKNVVRLKGGDPFLFGRGGEEIEALLAEGIPYEVIPGVTSAFAAPAAAGIPVTHRGLANSLHVITAHTKEGGLADADYAALARLGGTLLFHMGAAAVPEICRALLSHGFSPNTPVAAVERGTTARQRRVEGTLGTFVDVAAREGLQSPAVIVVGETVRLGARFDWKKWLPLSGRKVVVTRPRQRQSRLSEMLRDLGAEVVEFPCIATETLRVPLPSFEGCRWIGFTSAAGVESFFELLAEQRLDVRAIGSAKIAAIGPATADTLRSRGLAADLVPKVYDGVHLAAELAERAQGGLIMLFRAQEGSPELTAELNARGAHFQETALYRTVLEGHFFTPSHVDAVLFTSASTVRGFMKACPGLTSPLACCIGAQTAAEAAKAGFGNIRIAEKATLEHLIKTLRDEEK